MRRLDSDEKHGDDTTDENSAESVEAEKASAEPAEKSVLRSLWEMIREFFLVIGTALLISLIIKTFLFQMFYIPSKSMESTLIEGDRVVASQLTPGLFDLQRGDIIVFEDPGGWLNEHPGETSSPFVSGLKSALTFVGVLPKNSGKHLIKRIIGMPGDVVECCNEAGRLTINGEPIKETYVKDGSVPSDIAFETVVPEGRLWVMGDNRSQSKDSRFNRSGPGGGTVALESVVGRATMIAWPVSRWAWLGHFEEAFANVPAEGQHDSLDE